jgi:hypothetical protein
LAIKSGNRQQLQLLFYLACMLQFAYAVTYQTLSLNDVKGLCPDVPSVIITSIFNRFTEDTGKKDRKSGQLL